MTAYDDDALIAQLFELGAVKLGRFTLKSGAISPIYIDLRLMISDPKVLAAAAKGYASLLTRLDFDRIAAIPMAGLPIGTAVALETGRPMIFPACRSRPMAPARPSRAAGRSARRRWCSTI